MGRFERMTEGGGSVTTATDEDYELQERLRATEEELDETRKRLAAVESLLDSERAARSEIGAALTARLVSGGARGSERGEVQALITKLEREQEAVDSLSRQLESAWRRNHALGAMVAKRHKSRWRRLLRRS